MKLVMLRRALIVARTLAVLTVLLSIPAGERALARQPPEHSSNAESREEYQRRIQAKLDELSRQMKALEAQGKTEGVEAQQKLRREYRQFSNQHREAARQFEQLKAAGRESWEKARPQLEAAVDELEKAYRKLASQLNKEG
jgi:hypothetical protein